MSLFRFEKDMREPVLNWIRGIGMIPAVEFQIWHMVDIVAGEYGVRPGKRRKPNLEQMIAIELKLNDVSTVISQAKENLGQCDCSFCALPIDRCSIMRNDTLRKFQDAGVGLISVGRGSVDVVLRSSSGDGAKGPVSKRLWRRVRKIYSEMYDNQIKT